MYNFDIMIDGHNLTTVMEFIEANTAPDVDPLTADQINQLLNMNEGQKIVFFMGAGGEVSIKRLPDETLQSIQPRQYFPNGFDNWHETYYQIAKHMEETILEPTSAAGREDAKNGLGGVWLLAKALTDKFEGIYKGVVWGEESHPDWFDALEDFLRAEDERLTDEG